MNVRSSAPGCSGSAPYGDCPDRTHVGTPYASDRGMKTSDTTHARRSDPATRLPHVLLVDDCDTSLLLEELALQDCCHLAKARNGEDALALVRARPIDLVLLDLGLPGIGGVEVLRQLAQIRKDVRPAIVIITSDGRAETLALVRDLGCDGVLLKPASLASLRDGVARCLARRSGEETGVMVIGGHGTRFGLRDRVGGPLHAVSADSGRSPESR